MITMSGAHIVRFKVRDYECDMQAVVNNGVYQNYLEHSRHEFLLSKGIDFASVTAEGINLVVIRAELDYLRPLRSGDEFEVHSRVERLSRLKLAFRQDIFRLPDEQQMLRGMITATAVNEQGKPFFPEFLKVLLEDQQ